MSRYAQHYKRKSKNQFIILLTSVALLLAFAVGTTISYFVNQTEQKENVFEPSKVACEVEEKFDDNIIKSEVKIINTGDTEAYIRATVVVTWVKDGTNEVSALKPEAGLDYEINYNTYQYVEQGWIHDDATDFWYYTKPIKPASSPSASDAESTEVLIESCKSLTEKPGYHLTVEIVASAIQSAPQTVVEDNWGVTVDDRTGYITAVPSAASQGGAGA